VRACAPDGNAHDTGRRFHGEVLLKHEVQDLSLPGRENSQRASQPIGNRATVYRIGGVC
jgi:hypothetical protein